MGYPKVIKRFALNSLEVFPNTLLHIFIESAPRLFQSISHNVHEDAAMLYQIVYI